MSPRGQSLGCPAALAFSLSVNSIESLPLEEMMLIDVSGGSEQTKLNFFSAGTTRRESSSFDASHLMLLCMTLVVDNVINTRLRNDAAYSVVHLSHLLVAALNRLPSGSSLLRCGFPRSLDRLVYVIHRNDFRQSRIFFRNHPGLSCLLANQHILIWNISPDHAD